MTKNRKKQKFFTVSFLTKSHKKYLKHHKKQKQGSVSYRGLFLLFITIGLVFFFHASVNWNLSWPELGIGAVLNITERRQLTFSDNFYARADALALLYDEGRDVYYLNTITLNMSDWESERLMIGGHDDLGRTRPIIAFLSEHNLGTAATRASQTHQPTGWYQNQFNINNSYIWVKNRGHLIAYTLTFNFNDEGYFSDGYLGSEDAPYNLFTQTSHANQNVMTQYEADIRHVLASGSEVIFKAAPIFRDDELMARGIWLQALSSCETLALSVYIFNRQPGVQFDFSTGENWLYSY